MVFCWHFASGYWVYDVDALRIYDVLSATFYHVGIGFYGQIGKSCTLSLVANLGTQPLEVKCFETLHVLPCHIVCVLSPGVLVLTRSMEACVVFNIFFFFRGGD